MKHKRFAGLFLSFLLLAGLLHMPAAPVAGADTDIVPNVTLEEWEVVKLINELRLDQNLHPYAIVDALQETSGLRMKEVMEKGNGTYSSIRPDGSEYLTIFKETGVVYSGTGETSAQGYFTPRQVMQDWGRSGTGPYKRVTSKNFKLVGLNHYADDKSTYKHSWIMHFIGPYTDNTFSNLRILSNTEGLVLLDNQDLTDLNLVMACDTSRYQTAYIPISEKMCSPIDRKDPGLQTITVRYEDMTAEFELSVSKPAKKPPEGLRAIPPTKEGAADGRIIGITNDMEYRMDNESVYTPCPNTAMNALVPGSYYIRYPAGADYSASPTVKVIVPKGGTTINRSYMNGYTDGSFGPGKEMTRAEVAAMFYNLYKEEQILKNAPPVNPPDPEKPDPEKPDTEKPDTEKPDPEKPDPEKPSQTADLHIETSSLNAPSAEGETSGKGDETEEPGKGGETEEPGKGGETEEPNKGGETEEPNKGGETGTPVNFSDVPDDSWYTDAVRKLAELEVIKGYPDGTFLPQNKVTRAEFVVMAVAFTKTLPSTADIKFPDVPEEIWYRSQLETAVANQWVSGYEDGSFLPQKTITRTEVSIITNKALKRAPDTDFISTNKASLRSFTDLPADYWAYAHVMTATNNYACSADPEGSQKWASLV